MKNCADAQKPGGERRSAATQTVELLMNYEVLSDQSANAGLEKERTKL